MSSLPFLTSELQALSKEAGRRHGDVKEAADKALALLKSSPESALSDLHEAADSSSSSGKYPVLLAPIVLGCSTKNPKVTSIAVSGLQRLTGVRGAITQATVPIILSTLRSVLSQGVEIQLKILQTLVSLLTNCKDVHDDLLAETLLISFKLLESKIGVVSSTAAATLRQLVMFVFENVDEEDRLAKKAKEDPSLPAPVPTDFSVSIATITSGEDHETKEPHYLLPAARDAYLVFDDICLLVNGEQPSFLKLQSLPRTFGLELIESVLSDFSNVFISHPELLHLLRTLLSPLLIRSLAEKPSFSTTLRLMRVMYLLLKKFNDHLVMESEIFLCMFIKIVAPGDSEGSGGHPLSSSMLPTLSKDNKAGSSFTSTHVSHGSSPPWMRVLALEILRGLCGDFELLSKIWTRYDAAQDASNLPTPSDSSTSVNNVQPSRKVPVFRSMITALNKLATEKPILLGSGSAVISGVAAETPAGEYTVGGVVDGLVGMAQQAATSVGVSGLSQGSLSLATASVKLQCIDQLDKSDAPHIPETYVFLLSLQCLNAIAEGFAAYTLPMYSTVMSKRPRKKDASLPAPPALNFESAPQVDKTYDSLRTTRDMADAAWPALLASLSFFISTNLDDELFSYTVSAFQQFSTTCGVLALNTPRDAFLISLCKFAVPPNIIANLAAADSANSSSSSSRPQLNSVLSAGADALGFSAHTPQPMSLSTRNLLCLRALVHVAQALAGSLERTWFYVFEALQNADLVVRTEANRRLKKRPHPPHSAGISSSPSKHSHTSSATTTSAGSSAAPPSPMARFIPSDQEEQAAQARATRLFETSKVLDDDAFRWFLAALCRLNAEMIGIPVSELGQLVQEAPAPSPHHTDGDPLEDATGSSAKHAKRSGINVIRTLRPGEKSYAVTKLGDVSLMNMSRMTTRSSEAGWDVVIGHLLLVQHWQQAPAIVRLQASEVFDNVVSTAPKASIDQPESVQRDIQNHVFEALAKQVEPHGRSQVSTDVEIREAGLGTLYRILESQGHALVCGWKTIFKILQTACPGRQSVQVGTTETSLATATKTAQLVRVAFPSLQLICSDFLSALSIEESGMCIDTLTAFGGQIGDTNVALTAGNLLWQVSDHLQAARRQGNEPEAHLQLWMSLLHGLLDLCKDRRQEARDGAIQILWRSIELYGATLDEAAWDTCLWSVIFPLLKSLDDGITKTEEETSVDTAEKTALGIPLPFKQWDDSKVLALSSAGSVFSNELPGEISKLSSFERVCKEYTSYLQASFQQDRPAVANAAAKALEKLAGIRWDSQQHGHGVFAATTLWNAWAEIGRKLQDEPKHGLTQQNLESYTKVAAILQEQGHLESSDDRYLTLLAILKTIITYPYSPDYRPDQDTMPATQAIVMEVVSGIAAKSQSATVISSVLQDLAEYMTLAYRNLSDTVKSPTLSETPRRQNQKVTYVALSKACTSKLLEIYQRFKDVPAIYESAVDSILAAYAVPLRLKYECPAPSRFGDDPPLWKTATSHFLQLARTVVQSIDIVSKDLDNDAVARVWRRLAAAFRAMLQADCRAVLDMSIEDQRMEEDFDLAVIVTLESDILPQLGKPEVPTDAITSLTRALRDASQLHETVYGRGGIFSPSMTAVNSASSADSQSRMGDSSMQTSYDQMLDGTTVDDEERPRERFAYWALDLLFSMCNHHHQELASASSQDRKRIAVLTLPLLFNRCLSVLQLYLADSSVRGKVPFRRVREEELAYILDRLGKLELDENIFEASFADDDPVEALRAIDAGQKSLDITMSISELLAISTRRSSRAHLYELYPKLLALVTLPRLSDGNTIHCVPYASLDFGSPIIGSTHVPSMHKVTAEKLSSHLDVTDSKELSRKCLELIGDGFSRRKN